MTAEFNKPQFDQPQFAQSADGSLIAFYDHGGHGPDLILGHASGFCAAVWAEVVEALRANFRCVTYDTRAHGESTSPISNMHDVEAAQRTEVFDWERLADDIDAVIDAADLSQPFGVGHSSGGAAQVLLSERGDYLNAMFLFEPVIFDDHPPRGPWPDRDLAQRTRGRRTHFSSRDQAFSSFRERGPFSNLTESALRAYVNFGFKPSSAVNDAPGDSNAADSQPVELILNPLDEAEIYSLATDHFGFQRLGQITCPTTIAHGATSKSFTHKQMSNVSNRITNAKLMTFEDRGHFAPLERPTEFAQLVTKFFLDIAGTSH